MIVAHLDLDAFFAAVEQLEDPTLRRKPLVVGGDPQGRGVVATANYVARTYGIHSAMSCAEALRRCPRRCSSARATRCTASTRRRSGRRCARSCPPSSRPGSTRATSTSARSHRTSSPRGSSPRRCRPPSAARRALTCSLGVATCKVVAKVASDRRKPGGLTVVPPGTRGGVPRAVRRPPPSGRRPARGGAAPHGRDRDDRRPRRRSTTPRSAACSRARSGRCSATASRGIDARGPRDAGRARSRSRPRRRSSATSAIASSSTRSCGGWP